MSADCAASARAAMVARLEAAGHLGPGPVREALLALPREVLMPQAYIRRSTLDERPPRWDLLDWSEPGDREELLAVLYGGESVLIQHDGEPLVDRPAGGRSGGAITSMSTVMGLTVSVLEELDLRAGQRVLDVGTGAGVTAAVACHVCGDTTVVTLDRDPNVAVAAQARLGALGFRPTVVSGNGESGWPAGAPYDRIFVSFALPSVPEALVDQLAPGGVLLMHITTESPSWPALAVVSRGPDGRISSRLRAVEFAHRAAHGRRQIFLSPAFRERIAARRTDGGTEVQQFRSSDVPPPEEARGFWLALDALHPGLVQHRGVDDLVIGAPGCGSWMAASPDGSGAYAVTAAGPRNIWTEIHQTALRWRDAGEPEVYRLDLEPDGTQRVNAGHGESALAWQLPAPRDTATEGNAMSTPPREKDALSASPNGSLRSGGCLCWRIRFTVTGTPDYPHTCSCTHCQRLSGGPMMSWVSFPLSGLTWTGDGGEPAWHYTWPDSRRGFCPDCGSQLCALDDGASSIAITFSALDDASGLVPVNQSFREDAVTWLPPVPDTQHSKVT
ncbi:GFA family protein [Streptomyces lydicamycinicus]|uniref:GFA family protein n=1 Tax=Streptomyces lydicamycinicus TaxID=1546107 RepID=UPI003C2BCD6F